MGNVPIYCCRSKSPRPDSESRYSGENNAHHPSTSTNSRSRKQQNNSKSKNDTENCDSAIMQQASQNILQHISEREPDDSETDPSSNPLNRPIFAQRSSSSKNQQCKLAGAHDSYSSNLSSSIARKQTLTPLTSSQDQGYNSGASNNLTLYESGGHLTSSSFGSTIIRSTNDQSIVDSSPQHLISSPDEQTDGSNVLIDTNSTDDRLKSKLTNDTLDRHSNQQHSRRSYLCSNHDDERLPIGGDDRLKASSCSTIFIDNSTISQPDLDQTIKCVSLAIYYHIRNRSSDTVSEIFDEAIHPLRMPSYSFNLDIPQQQHPRQTDDLLILDNDDQTKSNSQKQIDEPDQEIIYNFVRTLFKAAQLTSEYAITTLVYLERLMTYAEMDLTPRSWRRMFLGAILLSSKVWEDQAIWNVDYAQIFEEISVDDINELERQFLELIQFNMNVPSSVYAKYYFHLRTLALKNGLTEEQTIMTTGKAKELEAMSNVHSTDNWFSSPIHRRSPLPIKKHTSLEKLRSGGNARAVLM